MSKAVARALEDVCTALKTDAAEPPADAVCVLIGEGLSFLERIALALEERNKAVTVAPMGEGTIVGELAKFEPVISPELAERAVVALEKMVGDWPTPELAASGQATLGETDAPPAPKAEQPPAADE